MPTGSEFKDIAERRLDEALILQQAGRHDGAYYLAGYVIECALKAVISKRLDYDIYNEKADDLRNFRVHKIKRLVLFAGFIRELADTPDYKLKTAYSFVSHEKDGWDETKRYEPTPCGKQKCDDFINAVQTLMTWIRQHW